MIVFKKKLTLQCTEQFSILHWPVTVYHMVSIEQHRQFERFCVCYLISIIGLPVMNFKSNGDFMYLRFRHIGGIGGSILEQCCQTAFCVLLQVFP